MADLPVAEQLASVVLAEHGATTAVSEIETAEFLALFGQLIANTDVHRGGMSFFLGADC